MSSFLGGLFGSSNNTKQRSLDRTATSYGDYATQDRNQFLDIMNGGQDALNASTQAAVSSAMPSFDNKLQQVRESAIRRGISTGDLGTSYEGDLASAFQRNIANATAGQAMNMYSTRVGAAGNLSNQSTGNYLDLLTGNADRAQSASNAGSNFFSGLIGAGSYLAGKKL